ncbi:hypothetical protein [Roseicyclus sp.]|uniref:hypothetical protein n=1 Tax=Roseicyclus sp. TaxID=1914329 RepID=UPI003FA0CFBF
MTRWPAGVTLAVILVGGAVLLWPRTHSAEAVLDGGESVTLRLRPMLSLQSDWRREIVVQDADGRRTIPLLEDTGWWRGSQLYRRPDGALVLDEGQAGCVLLSGAERPAGCPVATEWDYLGRFGERGRGEGGRAVFLSPTDAAEIDLPEAL